MSKLRGGSGKPKGNIKDAIKGVLPESMKPQPDQNLPPHLMKTEPPESFVDSDGDTQLKAVKGGAQVARVQRSPHGVQSGLSDEFRKLGYEIVRKLGQGGMGEVFEAKYMGNPETLGLPQDGKVAIKLLSDIVMSSDDVKTRFFREAEYSRNIKHPNVVKVYESGEISGRPFLVMEYLKGTDLHSIIAYKARANNVISIGRALRIVRDACSALMEAHSKGIIHRDIKPENIFIVKEGGEEKVKLIDLGLAKLADLEELVGPKLTKTGHFSGTPFYMAPEMIPSGRERAVFNHRIDIYSMGVTLYEMLCGSLPFEAQNHVALIYNLKTQQPQSPQERRPALKIPDEINALVMKCIQKDPAKRYQSMEELIDAIDSCGIVPEEDKLLDGLKSPSLQKPKMNLRPLRWILPLFIASALSAGGVAYYKLSKPHMPVQAPATQEASGQVYNAKIVTDIPGVEVVMEEKLESGTVVPRPLGKTPLEVPLEGEQTLYLKLDGYARTYVKVSPANPSLRHTMVKRD